jgi:hypothetical protein
MLSTAANQFFLKTLLRLPAEWLELPQILARSKLPREAAMDHMAELASVGYIEETDSSTGPLVRIPMAVAGHHGKVLTERTTNSKDYYQRPERHLYWTTQEKIDRAKRDGRKSVKAESLADVSDNTQKALSYAEVHEDGIQPVPKYLLSHYPRPWFEIDKQFLKRLTLIEKARQVSMNGHYRPLPQGVCLQCGSAVLRPRTECLMCFSKLKAK